MENDNIFKQYLNLDGVKQQIILQIDGVFFAASPFWCEHKKKNVNRLDVLAMQNTTPYMVRYVTPISQTGAYNPVH